MCWRDFSTINARKKLQFIDRNWPPWLCGENTKGCRSLWRDKMVNFYFEIVSFHSALSRLKLNVPKKKTLPVEFFFTEIFWG